MQITHAEFWPGLAFDTVLDMPYDVWVALALSTDAQVADIERARNQQKG